jgi:Domain of unknown function (DUF5103)
LNTLFSCFLILVFPLFSLANGDNPPNVDSIYVKNLCTVLVSKDGRSSTFPIFDLMQERIVIKFDDIDADVKNYLYTIELCNENWSPTILNSNEYLDGFPENRINYPTFSSSSFTNFTHYSLAIPNENVKITKSGNYILKIYENVNGEKKLVISRRLIAAEQIVAMVGEVINSTNIGTYNTHHEVNFAIINKDNKIISPQQELHATVLQNGRWDGGFTGLKPNLFIGDKVQFNVLGKVVFAAGKEFRWLDLTSLRYRTDRVDKIKEYDTHRELTLVPDRARSGTGYQVFKDLNGEYNIDNLDNTSISSHLGGDYAFVLFNLQMPRPIPNAEVYVVGAFNNWKRDEKSLMEYVPSHHAYAQEIFLKQGYYNYEYIVVPNDTQIPTHELTEGDWYETENNYQVIIYYRPFGGRYDRVISARTMNTARFGR